jgi:predicted  nucleic acid-binding Zn-ribbon protein
MSVRQLYDLQKLDVSIGQAEERLASIETRLNDRSTLDALDRKIDALRKQLVEVERQRKAREMEEASTRQKLQTLERRMYGGEVTNVRELEGMGEEQKALRSRLEREEEQLLEVMASQEEVEQSFAGVSADLDSETERWESERKELTGEKEAETKKRQDLVAERETMAAPLAEQDLTVYESLRKAKKGEVVVKVERGLCTACKMSLPTHVLQRARSGKEHVFCTSCGRLLYVS